MKYMSEFISEFGKENFIIIIVVVGVIVLALIVIVLIEKFQIKSKMKQQIKRQISNINMAVNNVPRPGFNNVRNNNISSNRSEPVITQNNYNDVSAGEAFSYDNSNSVNINSNASANINTNTNTNASYAVSNDYNDGVEFDNYAVSNTEYSSDYNDSVSNNDTSFNDSEVVYADVSDPAKEAEKELEEVTKKLIDKDDDLIDHTHFETEQEEKSIISYEELVRASHDVDEKNDKLLEDEGEAAITLDELYKKHVEEQNIIEEEKPVKVNNPVFEGDEPRKFKNSEVISTVFGFYSGEVKGEKKSSNDILKRMDSNMKSKELEEEIKETENFLYELKKLKDKLD